MMKKAAVRAVSILAYWLGLDALFYFLNRRAKRIVTFHNVIPDDLWVPFPNLVSNKASEFAKIVGEVGRRFKFSADVLDPDTATLTFDDGYLNQYEVAGRMLMERGIPAVVFAAGDALAAKEPDGALVVDQLMHWLGLVPEDVIGAGGRLRHWMQTVRPRYAGDGKSRGRNALRELDSRYPMKDIWAKLPAEYLRLRLTGIPCEKLDDLRNHGWTIGWHSRTHYPLSSLGDDDIRSEIAPPDGFKGVVFSYPYGERLSVDERCVRIARESGYPCAVSNESGRSSLAGRFFLPRMSLHPDRYRLHFRLSGLEHFLKTGRLLPVV